MTVCVTWFDIVYIFSLAAGHLGPVSHLWNRSSCLLCFETIVKVACSQMFQVFWKLMV
jgi:hypothetical protein